MKKQTKNATTAAAATTEPGKLEKYMITAKTGPALTTVLHATSEGDACEKWAERYKKKPEEAQAVNVSQPASATAAPKDVPPSDE